MNFEQFFGGFGGGMPFGMGGGGRPEPQGPKTFKLYELFGAEKDVDAAELKKKYRVMSMKGEYCHPDRGGSREKFQQLQEAWNWLGELRAQAGAGAGTRALLVEASHLLIAPRPSRRVAPD
jgi:hypothetical protein